MTPFPQKRIADTMNYLKLVQRIVPEAVLRKQLRTSLLMSEECVEWVIEELKVHPEIQHIEQGFYYGLED